MAGNIKTVASPSAEYTVMKSRWDMVEALLGGTETMRAGGRKYLPQYEAESDSAYLVRLDRATLLNLTELTLGSLAGRPFGDPVQPNADVPEVVRALLDDVDLQGHDLTAFCRGWFMDGLAKGWSYALVDFPVVRQDASRPRTLEDDRREGVRPFWTHVCPEAVLARYSELVNGLEVTTHVRILEESVERDGWGERTIRRIRVLEPGRFELWRNVRADEWEKEDEGDTALPFIPLVKFQTAVRGKPPLLDLAHLNVTHWQSASDQRNCLTTARFPLLAVSGAGQDETRKVAVGPNRWLSTENPDGRWYYVEHTGAAIAAGQADLEHLERAMAAYGAEFLQRKPGTMTATERALNSAEALSQLEAWTLDFRDCVEQALWMTARWLGLDEGGTVGMCVSFEDQPVGDQPALDALHKARGLRDISRQAYLDGLKRLGVLDEEFDAEVDAALLADETSLIAG